MVQENSAAQARREPDLAALALAQKTRVIEAAIAKRHCAGVPGIPLGVNAVKAMRALNESNAEHSRWAGQVVDEKKHPVIAVLFGDNCAL